MLLMSPAFVSGSLVVIMDRAICPVATKPLTCVFRRRMFTITVLNRGDVAQAS